MFTKGFDKIAAGLGYPIGRTVGAASAATKKVKGAVGSLVTKQKAGFAAGVRKSTTGATREVGQGLANRRAPTSADVDVKKAREDVFKRSSKMKDTALKNKPSFARKHPFITAGALYLGTKAALGGGDDNKQSSQPQYVGPQQ